MATVLSLKILDNGDQLKAQCDTVGSTDTVTIHYYRGDELIIAHVYHHKESLIRVFRDIENVFSVIV
mgnify:CR=1 FL=1